MRAIMACILAAVILACTIGRSTMKKLLYAAEDAITSVVLYWQKKKIAREWEEFMEKNRDKIIWNMENIVRKEIFPEPEGQKEEAVERQQETTAGQQDGEDWREHIRKRFETRN